MMAHSDKAEQAIRLPTATFSTQLVGLTISDYRISVIIIIAIAPFVHMTWPTKIVAIRKNNNQHSFFVIIKHSSFTDEMIIEWWLEHKSLFRENLEASGGEKDYLISFWISDYKVMPENDQDSEMLCFEDMDTPENCIEKYNR